MNKYILKIEGTTKYTTWYTNIISNAISRIENSKPKYIQKKLADELLGYSERHHIYPVCMCEDKTDILSKYNIVHLTAREHFICHWLLCKIYKNNRKLKHALGCFIQESQAQHRKLTSRQYQTAKMYKTHACTGTKHTDSHRAKNSEANKGRKLTTEHKNNIRLSKLGQSRPSWVVEKMVATKMKNPRTASSETKNKISKASLGSNNGNAKIWTIKTPTGDIFSGCLSEIATSIGVPYNKLYYTLKTNPNWKIISKI